MNDNSRQFEDVASELGPLLDKFQPETANDTFLSLNRLGEKLPEDSSLRRVIEQQMAHMLSYDFPLSLSTANKTMTTMAQLKERFPEHDGVQQLIDGQMARVVAFKLEPLNAQLAQRHLGPHNQASQELHDTPKPEAAHESHHEEHQAEAFNPHADDEPKQAEASTAAEHHDEPKPQVKAEESKPEPKVEMKAEEPVKEESPAASLTENEKPVSTPSEPSPAEADELAKLYAQVAESQKRDGGVFAIFQREYGGDAHRFVTERTDQYAKYMSREEAREEMLADLKQLVAQAKKSVESQQGKPVSNGASNGPAFLHP